jgi:hypothetical protein
MNKPAVKVRQYGGKEVMQNADMESIRAEECLCMNCAVEGCTLTVILYELCTETNTRVMVTECPRFVDRIRGEVK